MRARELSGDEAGSRREPASALAGGAVAADLAILRRLAGNRAVSRAVRAGALDPQRRTPRPVAAQAGGNPFADPAASKDAASAARALQAYSGLAETNRHACIKAVVSQHKTAGLARVLRRLSAEQLGTYRDALTEILAWVQAEETLASAGMTYEQMALEQRNFVKRAPAPAVRRPSPLPSDAEMERWRLRGARPPVKSPDPLDWPMTFDERKAAIKADLTERGEAAIRKVVGHAAIHWPELGLDATHFKVDLESVGDAIGASVPDGPGGWQVAVGRAFIEAADVNPEYLKPVVVHERSHPEYPASGTYSGALYDAAIGPPDNTEYRGYGRWGFHYLESEVRATMRDLPHYTRPRRADLTKLHPDFRLDPATRLTYWLGQIKDRWSPRLIVALLRGFRARQAVDPRITPAALRAFDRAVLLNFGAATLRRIKG
jgi:hypothetical protein